MKYSNKYTVINGITNFSNVGKYFIFSLNVNGSSSPPFSITSLSLEGSFSTDFSITLLGRRSINQNATASNAGTTNITSKVATGVKPNSINPAYDSAPITPAPPVPDDHVEITFLC